MNKFFQNKIVVGLGNPGAKYENTLHNVGFLILDNLFVRDATLWSREKNFESLVAKVGSTIFVKPQTYMNDSGKAISKILNFYKRNPDDLVVIHDDVDLEFAKIKLVKNRGSAGHHGVEDTLEKLGTLDFYRIRVGVGRPENNSFNVQDYVLSGMNQDKINEILESFEKFSKTV